jgi:hypothetical protein
MEIFIADTSNENNLENVAHILKIGLSLEDMSERESSNYTDGHYFQAFFKGKRVKLYCLDTEGLDEWSYILDFSDELDSIESVAIQIAKLGFECFIPDGEWYS